MGVPSLAELILPWVGAAEPWFGAVALFVGSAVSWVGALWPGVALASVGPAVSCAGTPCSEVAVLFVGGGVSCDAPGVLWAAASFVVDFSGVLDGAGVLSCASAPPAGEVDAPWDGVGVPWGEGEPVASVAVAGVAVRSMVGTRRSRVLVGLPEPSANCSESK